MTQTFNTVQPLCKYNLVKQLERSVCVCIDNLLLFFIFEIKYLNHLFLLKKNLFGCYKNPYINHFSTNIFTVFILNLVSDIGPP